MSLKIKVKRDIEFAGRHYKNTLEVECSNISELRRAIEAAPEVLDAVADAPLGISYRGAKKREDEKMLSR